MKSHVFGLETEYAVGHQVPTGSEPRAETVIAYLLAALKTYYPFVQGDFGDSFLPNGGRLYRDMGHAEWATPECRSPLDLLAYDLAGDRILAELALLVEERLREAHLPGKIFMDKKQCLPGGLEAGR